MNANKRGHKVQWVSFSICLVLIGCGGVEEPKPVSATEQCGRLTNAFGRAFFCGTNQANLNVGGFEDGSTGYCMFTQQNLGNVGYSATTNRGGAFLVTTQSEASTLCGTLSRNAFPDNCTTYIRCTRI
jgi:hypothetical protein